MKGILVVVRTTAEECFRVHGYVHVHVHVHVYVYGYGYEMCSYTESVYRHEMP